MVALADVGKGAWMLPRWASASCGFSIGRRAAEKLSVSGFAKTLATAAWGPFYWINMRFDTA